MRIDYIFLICKHRNINLQKSNGVKEHFMINMNNNIKIFRN